MRLQFCGLARVARGAVTPRQLVQLLEQWSGVAHVAPHGLVGPPQLVRVKAQVQLDEDADVVDHLL